MAIKTTEMMRGIDSHSRFSLPQKPEDRKPEDRKPEDRERPATRFVLEPFFTWWNRFSSESGT